MPYDGCASATLFDDDSARIARTFKDAGERRLAAPMADIMASVCPLSWVEGAITFVPATLGAYRRRGFDHAELLAENLSAIMGLPCLRILDRPKSKDQRALGRNDRFANMAQAFRVSEQVQVPDHVLLIDDVYTTGATLCAASSALRRAGTHVHALTFARVP